MDCSLPSSSVHGILQARTLGWVAVPFSRGSFQPRDPTQVSNPGLRHCRWILYHLSHQGTLGSAIFKTGSSCLSFSSQIKYTLLGKTFSCDPFSDFLNLSSVVIWGRVTVCCGDCLVHGGRLSNIPGFNPPDALSTSLQVMITKNISSYCQMYPGEGMKQVIYC